MTAVDWHALFALDKSPIEMIVRGTVMYWFLFLLFRFIMRRDVGAIGLADVLLVVIFADAAQNALSGGYQSLGEGMVLVGTLVIWNVLVDWLTFRSRRFRRFAEPRPLPLIRDGRLLEGNLRREMLTVSEVMAKLREQSVENVAQVRWAYMESDGQISLGRYDDKAAQPQRTRPTAPSGH